MQRSASSAIQPMLSACGRVEEMACVGQSRAQAPQASQRVGSSVTDQSDGPVPSADRRRVASSRGASDANGSATGAPMIGVWRKPNKRRRDRFGVSSAGTERRGGEGAEGLPAARSMCRSDRPLALSPLFTRANRSGNPSAGRRSQSAHDPVSRSRRLTPSACHRSRRASSTAWAQGTVAPASAVPLARSQRSVTLRVPSGRAWGVGHGRETDSAPVGHAAVQRPQASQRVSSKPRPSSSIDHAERGQDCTHARHCADTARR